MQTLHCTARKYPRSKILQEFRQTFYDPDIATLVERWVEGCMLTVWTDASQILHKYLPLAVLNYNTTYHSSIGCKPSQVIHGCNYYNVPDHKIGNNRNRNFLPTTEFAEELLKSTHILIHKMKENIMQSYEPYKEDYDRKAKAAPL